MSIARAIGKAIIEQLAPTGVGANYIIRMARAQGGGYRRTAMLEDIRVASDRFKNQYWVEKQASNEVVHQGLMVETELKANARYRVYGRMNYYDELDGQHYTEIKSFYTDDLANKGNWSDEFVRQRGKAYSGQEMDILSFEITAVEHNRGYPY